VNFGGIGVVIGHEMTHGFDDQGSKYDGTATCASGRRRRPQGLHRAHRLRSAEYNGFEASPAHDGMEAQNLNGKLTLGENTADNGGLRIAYMALLDTLAKQGKTIDDKIDGYTEAQRYFLGFAQVWCQNQTDQSARQSALTVDPTPRPLAHQRLGAELRRVRQGLRLQEGPAHVSGSPAASGNRLKNQQEGGKDDNHAPRPLLPVFCQLTVLSLLTVAISATSKAAVTVFGESKPEPAPAETRHNGPPPSTMQRGTPTPPSSAAEHRTLAASRWLRTKEKHEVQEIRQDGADRCP
jgi:hypothetical protein